MTLRLHEQLLYAVLKCTKEHKTIVLCTVQSEKIIVLHKQGLLPKKRH